jgi:hypothetical protein
MVVKSFAVKTGSDAGGLKPVSKLALRCFVLISMVSRHRSSSFVLLNSSNN